jgi:toxin HigB-1
MIRSFADNATRDIYDSTASKKARSLLGPNLWSMAQRKLDLIEAAININDLRTPPSNHLELLKGKRTGMYSIRINDQYRVIFKWKDEGAEEVQIIDYH